MPCLFFLLANTQRSQFGKPVGCQRAKGVLRGTEERLGRGTRQSRDRTGETIAKEAAVALSTF